MLPVVVEVSPMLVSKQYNSWALAVAHTWNRAGISSARGIIKGTDSVAVYWGMDGWNPLVFWSTSTSRAEKGLVVMC